MKKANELAERQITYKIFHFGHQNNTKIVQQLLNTKVTSNYAENFKDKRVSNLCKRTTSPPDFTALRFSNNKFIREDCCFMANLKIEQVSSHAN
jgi:hypothetical protein